MTPDNLKSILKYEPDTGDIYLIKTNRKFFPDDNNSVVVYFKGKSHRIKYSKLAYMLSTGQVLNENERIIHKNLDSTDYRACNLLSADKETYYSITEAQRNLQGGIRIVPHEQDQFVYVVHWEDKRAQKRKVHHDLASARKFEMRLKLKYSKIITRYCNLDI